ncbi:MAG: TonB-dependent receptor [Fidelibacterota bacterium]|nr:MAG: TonB-dependent receptor [Candidatus Neomarinimicrobiota bacterium]
MLAAVNISVQGTNLGATTAKDGCFILENLEPGQYDLAISHIGYRQVVIHDLTATADMIKQIEIALEPTILKGTEVVVTATRSAHALADVPLETHLVTSSEFRGLGVQTLTDVIRWIPGVNISGGAPNGAARRFTPLIHGLPAQYSMVMIDGERAKSEHIHTGTNINLIPVGMIERVEVVKGPSSALYGSEAFGGVINIITKPIPAALTWGTELSIGKYNTQHINLHYGNSINKVGFYLNANHCHSDGVPDANGIRFDFDQSNIMSKVAYQATESELVTIDTRFYRNHYLRSTSRPKVTDSWIDIHLHFRKKLYDNSTVKTGISYSHFQGEYRNDDNRTVKADATFEWQSSTIHSIITGFEVRKEQFSRTSMPQMRNTIFSAFLSDELWNTRIFNPIIALRVDHHPDVATELSPKLGILYKLTEQTNLRASIGEGFRAPSLQDLYEEKFDHKTYYRDGNPGLKPEFTTSSNVGIEYKFTDHLVGRVTGYRNEFTNMIMAISTGDSLNGKPIFRRENLKEARAMGFEIGFQVLWGATRIHLDYTYAETRDDEGEPLAYSPRHLTVLRLYHYNKYLKLQVMLSMEDARQRYFMNTEGEVDRLRDYTLVNLGLNRKIATGISLFIRLENLTDQKFAIYEDGKTLAGYGLSFLGGIKIVR